MSVATLKVWNYCMNRCEYCASRSNSDLWKPVNFIAAKNVLDIPSALYWLDMYRPNSEIHLSGGEPLLRPDIESVVNLCLASRRKVTVFTNGQMLPLRECLHELPLQWVVSWHFDAVSLEYFLSCIEPLRGKAKASIQAIVYRDIDEQAMGIVEKAFGGFDFRFRFADQTSKTWDLWELPEGCIDKPAEFLTLIEEDGNVYPCSSKIWGPIGSIYDPFNSNFQSIEVFNAHAAQCFREHKCGAHLSARLMEVL